MQSAFHEKCSYTMDVRGLLDGGLVMVRRMRAFGVVIIVWVKRQLFKKSTHGKRGSSEVAFAFT